MTACRGVATWPVALGARSWSWMEKPGFGKPVISDLLFKYGSLFHFGDEIFSFMENTFINPFVKAVIASKRWSRSKCSFCFGPKALTALRSDWLYVGLTLPLRDKGHMRNKLCVNMVCRLHNSHRWKRRKENEMTLELMLEFSQHRAKNSHHTNSALAKLLSS